jgi:two-component system nitrate/nitrite sensor histidine kinase NarX
LPRFVQAFRERFPGVRAVLGPTTTGAGVSILPQTHRKAGIPGVVHRPIETQATRSRLLLAWRASDRAPLLGRFLAMACRRPVDRCQSFVACLWRRSAAMSRAPWNLTTKLGLIGGALLLLALASIGLTLWVTWQLEGGAAAVNEAGRMRMQTWRLAQTLARGEQLLVQSQVRAFDESLELLRAGDPARPLFVPRDARSQGRFDDVRTGWKVLREAWTAPQPPGSDEAARQAAGFVDRIDAFVSAIEEQLARWTAILNAFQFALMLLAIGGAVALLYSAYLFVFDPLARLQRGLARIEQGDLAARVEVASRDEFGRLADGFNRMAGTLQGLVGQLEDKVREKTASLAAERERLAALYTVSALVGRDGTLAELAQAFAREVRHIADADASAVRWSDEGNERYVLLASDCLPQAIVEGEHCLATGDCACGQPQAQAATRVIPIRRAHGGGGADEPLGHCSRAGYEAIVSVPVRLHERVLGEVDLFYRHPTQLSDDDRSLLDTLASHLAGAMESLRAAALERETAVAEERGLLARELHDSIAQSLAFLKIQVQLLREAVRRGDAAQVERVIGELDAGVRESIADVRELLVHFRTRTNVEDIVPALQTTLQKFEHQTGLKAQLAVHGHGLPLPPDVQVQVLHVVQEALSNVRKHAQPHRVWVELHQGPRCRIEVRDDGLGFDAAASAGETQVGLRIMRERAASIGAQVEVHSAPGAGTRVVLRLPERAAQPLAA